MKVFYNKKFCYFFNYYSVLFKYNKTTYAHSSTSTFKIKKI
jgi:hypothetical protein